MRPAVSDKHRHPYPPRTDRVHTPSAVSLPNTTKQVTCMPTKPVIELLLLELVAIGSALTVLDGILPGLGMRDPEVTIVWILSLMLLTIGTVAIRLRPSGAAL